MAATLTIVRDGDPRSERTVELDGTAVVLGRHRDCDVVLDTEAVSRQHARVLREGGTFLVEDLDSRNGTRLNGRQLDAPAQLQDGDVVGICDWQLRFGSGAASDLQLTMVEGALSSATIVSARDATHADGPARRVDPDTALRAVLAVARDLGSNLNIDDLLPRVLDSVFELYPNADHGVIMLRETGGELVPKAMKSRRGSRDELVISRSIVGRAIERREAILSEDVAEDAKIEPSMSLRAMPIRSLMCVPLMGREQEALGVIALHTEVDGKPFTEGCLDMLTGVAMTAGIAVENAHLHERDVAQGRLERDLELAREVQRGFLPQGVPALASYAFCVHYEAAQSIGGDYYGFIPLADHRLGIAVGDVAGKGLPAALMMARLSSDVRFSMVQDSDPARALARINESFVQSGVPEGRFVTFLLMVLDTERHVLRYANAGHPPPLLRRTDGSVEPLRDGRLGVPLNITDEPELQAQTGEVSLERGETVLVYTDGLSETMDEEGELFGEERIRAAFAAAGGEGVDAVVDRLVLDMAGFAEELRSRDDTTIVCFTRR